ncbi:MAG: hypothetical protein ACRC5M_02330 [Anaeroplasmataceae bacterium]
MKKIILIISTLGLIFLLTGCSKIQVPENYKMYDNAGISFYYPDNFIYYELGGEDSHSIVVGSSFEDATVVIMKTPQNTITKNMDHKELSKYIDAVVAGKIADGVIKEGDFTEFSVTKKTNKQLKFNLVSYYIAEEEKYMNRFYVNRGSYDYIITFDSDQNTITNYEKVILDTFRVKTTNDTIVNQ